MRSTPLGSARLAQQKKLKNTYKTRKKKKPASLRASSFHLAPRDGLEPPTQ
jgi:hypothetical protein